MDSPGTSNFYPQNKNKEGQTISSDKKRHIINLYEKVVTEEPKFSKTEIATKLSCLCGTSIKSILSIMKEYLTTGTVTSDEIRPKMKTIFKAMDDFTINLIKSKVHEFFYRNEEPTLDKILHEVNEDNDLPNFKRTTLYHVLKGLNFTFVKGRQNNSRIVDSSNFSSYLYVKLESDESSLDEDLVDQKDEFNANSEEELIKREHQNSFSSDIFDNSSFREKGLSEESSIENSAVDCSFLAACIPQIKMDSEDGYLSYNKSYEDEVTCYHCGYSCPELEELRDHIHSEHLVDRTTPVEETEYEDPGGYPEGVLSRYMTVHFLEGHFMSGGLEEVDRQRKERPCPYCDYKAVHTSQLRNHIKTTHPEEKPYKCSFCDYSSAQFTLLKSHIKSSHTQFKRYYCSFCNYTSAHSHGLRYHIRAKHTMERPYKCEECDYSTVLKSSLNSHMRTRHSNYRPYKCQLCNYTAAQNKVLRIHIRSKHVGEKAYKCNFCEYSAFKSHTLNGHIRAKHTGERPYSCSECEYKSAESGTLREHIRSKHTNERPFKCSWCDYSSVHSPNLARHIRSQHSYEKPYKCTFSDCDYSASEAHVLQCHVRSRHTRERPYKCPLCNYSFIQQAHLKRHSRLVHRVT